MKPLEGITVLEFSTMITASFAAMMLAEQGARVIKVEPMEMGDPMRYIGVEKAGISSLFANCNRGKESIRVNLKSEEGQALIREMIPGVDIVVHNFRIGVMDRLNLGSDELRAINPRLIYAAVTGFGTEGDMARAPAYDQIIQAYAGFTRVQGVEGRPAFFRTLICDKITSYTLNQAVMCSLYQRERTGEGQHIDLSMLDSSLFFMFPDGFQNETLLDDDVVKQPPSTDRVFRLMPTKDGMVASAPATQDMLARSVAAVGLGNLMDDERFNTNEKLSDNYEEFFSLLNEAYSQFTTDEVIKKLEDADVPCARCLTREEVLTQQQLSANDSVGVIDHPRMGKMRVVKFPTRFGGKRLPPSAPSPDHGEHTAEVLKTFSVGEQRIASMIKSGVVR
ncbi:MAG: CoA transferase [Hyphomonas sp.]